MAGDGERWNDDTEREVKEKATVKALTSLLTLSVDGQLQCP